MVSVTDQVSDLLASGRLDFDNWSAQLPVALTEADRALLHRAWDLAVETYADRRRPSGESYFEHAVSVATILAGLKLDPETLAGALLHDVPCFDGVDEAELTRRFGDSVAQLVTGVHRMEVISDLHGKPGPGRDDAEQAETLRKMLLAMAQDVRVVFIKLGEVVHDLRTLKHLPEEVQRRIAGETRDIYSPLANRLGIWQLKWEMEDLSFRYLEPQTYKRVARMLAEKRQDRERYIEQVIEQLSGALARANIKAEINGRPKHIYSIWKKMQRKGLDFSELFDLRAVRVMVGDVASCYAALGVVHSLWRHIPKEFDDYIATPKENNYRSLHTAVIGPGGRTLEVQIRTQEMHEQAELGVAAHWRYKEGGSSDEKFERKIAWLRQILEWSKEEANAEDLLDRLKGELFEDRVYVISPKGDVVDLPHGATPLDFAYYIHSDIGNHCRGAKVNGRMVPLTSTLSNGDQVEVLTNRSITPSRDWLNPSRGYLATPRARSKVRSWFKQQDHANNVAAGRSALERELDRLGLHEVNLDKLAQRSRFPKQEEFLAAIGRGDVSSGQIANLLNDQVLPKPSFEEILEAGAHGRRSSEEGDDVTVYGVGNLLTRMAGCCTPAPGDAIVGYITKGEGVTIHRQDCANVRHLAEVEGERLIDVSWSRRSEKRYPVNIQVDAYDRQGLLRDITVILTNDKINVIGVNTATDRNDHHARMTLTVEIADVAQITRLMDKIAGLRNVMDVRRQV